MPILVDIILICYNQEQYIRRAISSIMSQDLEGLDARLIIADDASCDKTFDIISEFTTRLNVPYTILPREKNLGLVKNYQRSFSECRENSYIAILEGDDWWSSKYHIQQHISFLSSHQNYSMSINCFQFEFNDCELSKVCWPYGNSKFIKIPLKYQIEFGNQLGNMSACVFRSSIIKSIPDYLFRHNIADWEIGMCMAEKGPIAKLKAPTSVYLSKGEGQWTNKSAQERRQSRIKSIQLMDEYFEYKYHDLFDSFLFKVENSLSLEIPINRHWYTRLHLFGKKLKHILATRESD